MNLITHRSHIPNVPDDALAEFIIKRFGQLSFETDVPPTIILVNPEDDITGPDYAFVGNRGLLSDLFEEHKPGHPEFARPYEWVSFIPKIETYEILLLTHGEDGVLIFVPENVVNAQPELRWVLTDESQGGLSDPQPL
jgi:hypothetical protein